METQNIELTKKSRINATFNSVLVFIELTMLLSILIFSFFVIKGYSVLGHIPFYGDKEIVSFNGFDRKVVIIMLYPMWFGVYVWIFILVCSFLSNFKRKRKAVIFGLILCLLNILAMFSSQLAWIID
ncbi:hypothetical protein [Flavobacterium sp. SM2513]|uniref:hypothetical protein n=1 Tax=Flavobacterium sp. SM2513 TaxID=3424766 RepID=UPI003D7F48CF